MNCRGKQSYGEHAGIFWTSTKKTPELIQEEFVLTVAKVSLSWKLHTYAGDMCFGK